MKKPNQIFRRSMYLMASVQCGGCNLLILSDALHATSRRRAAWHAICAHVKPRTKAIKPTVQTAEPLGAGGNLLCCLLRCLSSLWLQQLDSRAAVCYTVTNNTCMPVYLLEKSEKAKGLILSICTTDLGLYM